MNDERIQILRMVQEGKVSPEEAAKLLEAVEQPEGKGGTAKAKPKSLRILIRDGARTQNIMLGVSLVKWILHLPGLLFILTGNEGQLDKDILQGAIDSGFIGKVFEGEEGSRRVEVWIDA
jgi:hypothetical protein